MPCSGQNHRQQLFTMASKEAMQAKTVEFSKNARSGNNYNIKKQFAEPIKKPIENTISKLLVL
jgi:hypothetical protein